MKELDVKQLNAFIVRAKAACYVGGGAEKPACRPGSHDLQFQDGEYTYLDSYFGGADFVGQEIVYHQNEPAWAMNYYGRILEPAMIAAAQAGQVIRQSLSRMYQEGRFLGGFEHTTEYGTYIDTSAGDVTSFTGREWIGQQGVRVYELVYHGGLIK
ncbi:MAG: hypothetical protein JW934_12015 [Anaerolineae bacterium]|nr:hypothetical protein [Anaerolineae bacterium]